MSFNRYYQSELSALRQLGRQFSERNPALAPFLAEAGQDPDVERLLEGFAFLTGRLRQKLDDELPELTHALMHLLWPNYMRPMPAFSILQFDPLKHAGPGVTVARDTPVESTAVHGQHCRFRTCYDTQVLPLQLKAVDFSAQGERATLSLRLEISAGAPFSTCAFERLRLHLAGDRCIGQGLYLSLLRHLEGVELLPFDRDGLPVRAHQGQALSLRLGAEQVQPVGFSEEQALIPYPMNTFRGYRHLQEYFVFPDKYLFVDVCGLDVLQRLPPEQLTQVCGVVMRFELRQPWREPRQPGLDNVKLYCTPIVNLFKHDALPIRLDGKQDEYLLMPGEYSRENACVFSVDRVTGWHPAGLGYQTYVPFESFEHDSDATTAAPSYSIRQRPCPRHAGLDTWLGFANGAQQDLHTLSVELTCTNHNLPRQLPIGAINRACEQTP